MLNLLTEILARLRLNPGFARVALVLALICSVVDLAASLAAITLMGPLVTVGGDMGVVGIAVIGFAFALGFAAVIDWCKWAYLEGLSAPGDAWHRGILARARPDNAAAIVAELDQQDASFGPVTLATLSEAPGGLVLLIALALISWQIALAVVAGIVIIWMWQGWQAEVAKAETDAWKAARQKAVGDPDGYFTTRRKKARTAVTRRSASQQGSTALYIVTLALGAVLVAQHALDPAALFAVGLLVNRLSGLTLRLQGVKAELAVGYESLGRLSTLLSQPSQPSQPAAQRAVLVPSKPQPQPQIQGAL